MRFATVISYVVTAALGFMIAELMFAHAHPPEHRNEACVVAKLLNLPNVVTEELETGYGFTPDTCIAQAADMNGAVRVPTLLVRCAVGGTTFDCKTTFDMRPKK